MFSALRVMVPFLLMVSLAACNRQEQPDHWPFTPEVERFVDIYTESGGAKLDQWVAQDTVPKPEVSLQKFQVMQGFEMALVASEPAILQPIDMNFDEKGRLWVVQYRQYPFPAGITVKFYDQYLRAEFDGTLQPPPHHVEGSDIITVLEDTNGDGVFDLHKDVITGLNITSSVLPDKDGVWVLTPPHLMFYPDNSGDGLPDGDPVLHLEGFGLEDTHAVANGLRYGPDGWIYGVVGSTTTSSVKGISWLGQAVWRYHPETGAFELYSEGGSNPWTLDFDNNGRMFTGSNGGNNRGFHRKQEARYAQVLEKHGPFTRPYATGMIREMQHEGYSARFPMTFVMYEEGRLPGYEGQLITGMALTNRVQASRLIEKGSTFRTVDTDSLVITPDRSFRPVDMKVGPDGAVYMADWCDVRIDHVDPRDTWNKNCGRIWRLQASDYTPVEPFDLNTYSDRELIALLGDERKWYRGQARRLLAQRGNAEIAAEMRKILEQETGQLALEAFWTLHLMEDLGENSALAFLEHPNAFVRKWTIRLLGDKRSAGERASARIAELARNESHPEVRSQLASSSLRLPADEALPVLGELIRRHEDVDDQHIPLMIWWALEEKISSDPGKVAAMLEEADLWRQPIFEQHLAEQIGRRYAAERGDKPAYARIDRYEDWIQYAYHPRSGMPGGKGNYANWVTNHTREVYERNMGYLARLLDHAPSDKLAHLMLKGMEDGFAQGPQPVDVPDVLLTAVDRLLNETEHSSSLISVAMRIGHPEAESIAMVRTEEVETGDEEKSQMAGLIAETRGEQVYQTHCALCHGEDGSGIERLAAPLRSSRWIAGDDEALIRIVLHGAQGEMVMPPLGQALNDDEVAAVLTYLRGAWGHEAGRISSGKVEQVRKTTADRRTLWTREELEALSD